MPLRIHTLVRHVGCAACTVVEENHLDLSGTVGLMSSVGEVVQNQAEKVHGPVRIHNFAPAEGVEGRVSDVLSSSSSTVFGDSSTGERSSGEDEEPRPPADEPAKGEDPPGGHGAPAAGEGNFGDDDAAAAAAGEVKMTGGKPPPGFLYNITAVVDWTTPPEDNDALQDMDLLRMHDEMGREVEDYLRSRGARDLIVLEYSLET